VTSVAQTEVQPVTSGDGVALGFALFPSRRPDGLERYREIAGFAVERMEGESTIETPAIGR